LIPGFGATGRALGSGVRALRDAAAQSVCRGQPRLGSPARRTLRAFRPFERCAWRDALRARTPDPGRARPPRSREGLASDQQPCARVFEIGAI